MIKKVVISAAGRGTRMKDLTKNVPKPLLKVKGKPFIYYLLENLRKAGFNEFIVVVGYRSEPIIKFLKEYDESIKIVNQFEELGEEMYGTACPILCSEKFIGNENFLSINGDNLYSPQDLSAFKIDDDFVYSGALRSKHPERYGAMITDGEFLVKIIEKPQKFYTDLVNINLHKFTPDVFKAVKKVKKSARGEYEITDAVSFLAKERKVKVKVLKDYWLDFGKPSDIEVLEKFIEKEYKK